MRARSLGALAVLLVLTAVCAGTARKSVAAPDPYANLVVEKHGPFDQSAGAEFLGEATLCTQMVSPPSPRPTSAAEIPPSSSPMPPPIQNFVGVTMEDQQAVLPPPTKDLANTPRADVSGAVGPNDYMLVVNVAVEVFTKDGRLRCGPFENDYWWHGTSCELPRGELTDAVVEYDTLADRWFAYHFDQEGRICVAVSRTTDPAGAYWLYRFSIWPSDPAFQLAGDYPKFGLWPDGIYYVSNARKPTGAGLGDFYGIYVAAFDRTAMLCGATCAQPPRAVEFFLQYTKNGAQATFKWPAWSMLPTNADGRQAPPPGAPNPVVQGIAQGAGSSITVWNFDVDFSNPSASTLTAEPPLTTEPFHNPCGTAADGFPVVECVVQPAPSGSSSGQLLESLGGFVMNRGVYRNFGDHASLLANQSVGTGRSLPNSPLEQTGVRWYELRSSGSGPWRIELQGTHAPDTTSDRWMGSMAMDQDGNMALGYQLSDATARYPSIAYAGRLAGDPGSALRGEVVAVPGKGSHITDATFADYTQMTVDPVDDCTFWYAGQFFASQEAANRMPGFWSTGITSFRFPSCGPGPNPAVTSTTLAGGSSPAGTGSQLAATGQSSRLGQGLALLLVAVAMGVGVRLSRH